MLDDFDRWLRTSLDKLSRKSDTAAAIQYELNRRQALLHHSDDGIIEIDNSAAQRALRGVAIGRRNYLFASVDSGGERAPAIYSLIGTAILQPPSLSSANFFCGPRLSLQYVAQHFDD